ncbi:uncharacterized protein LOC142236969 [Haematobia irritans]|uniref:uncharacterized protein LOC142236969 n=1 Tax=Haematobia irritans TaxID=7368 RepID=UPI003F4FF86B
MTSPELRLKTMSRLNYKRSLTNRGKVYLSNLLGQSPIDCKMIGWTAVSELPHSSSASSTDKTILISFDLMPALTILFSVRIIGGGRIVDYWKRFCGWSFD